MGPRGPKGPAGPQGAQGPQGVPAPASPAGSFYFVDSSDPPKSLGLVLGTNLVARQVGNEWTRLIVYPSGFFQNGYVFFASTDCTGQGLLFE